MTDTKFEGGFVELHCQEEDVDDSVKNKVWYGSFDNILSKFSCQQWFARPGLKLVGVSVGSCRCKHFLFPQYYNEDEVRCYLSIIIIISIVVFPFTLVMLAIACKIKNRVKSRVDVIIEMYNQAHVEQQPVAVKDNASRGRSSLNWQEIKIMTCRDWKSNCLLNITCITSPSTCLFIKRDDWVQLLLTNEPGPHLDRDTGNL